MIYEELLWKEIKEMVVIGFIAGALAGFTLGMCFIAILTLTP